MQSLTPGSDSPSGEAILAPPTASVAVRSLHALRTAGSLIRRYPFPALMALILIVIASASALAGVIAPFDPDAVEPLNRLQAPSWSHIMGTDALGRDVFSRILFGGQVSLQISVLAVGVASVISVQIGLLSGYLKGWVDVAVQRFVDVLLSFPGLFIIISISVFFGESRVVLISAIAIVLLGAGIRVARSAAMQVGTLPYIEAAQTIGATTPRIVFRHVAPNILAPVMVVATAQLGIAILLEATASFLGFGVQPPTASWGQMLGGEARVHMIEQPWLSLWPGLAIFLTVFSFNILGDTLRDILDPRLRGSQ